MRAVYLWKTSVPVHIHIKDVRSDRFTKMLLLTIHHTPFMCLSTWIATLILCAQVYAYTASRLCFFLLTPAHVTPLKDDSTGAHLHSIVVTNQAPALDLAE